MNPLWCVLLLFLRTAELRSDLTAPEFQTESAQEIQRAEDAASPDKNSLNRVESVGLYNLKRVARGAKDGSSRKRDPLPQNSYGHPRRYDDPSGYFTTPRTHRYTAAQLKNSSSGLLNPLFPVTDGSYWAYAVMLLALVLFAAGIVGNLALMCIVWHNFYLKSAWNCVLAGLAFWDFLVLFFCLPVVVFHELTLKRLLGDLSCRLVPYLEVRKGWTCARRSGTCSFIWHIITIRSSKTSWWHVIVTFKQFESFVLIRFMAESVTRTWFIFCVLFLYLCWSIPQLICALIITTCVLENT